MSYIPPILPRPDKPLGRLDLLRTARRNLLAIWPESCFHSDLFGYQFWGRNVLICNSPDTVREALLDNAAVLEQKSLQQRHALAPLIGDGLFISDGETWRDRRRVVAPVTHVSRLAELTPAITEGAAQRLAQWQALPLGSTVDALAEMAQMTAGVICTTIFGRHLGAKAAHTVVEAFTEYQSLVGQMDLMSLLGLPDFLPRFQGLRIRGAVRRIHRVIDDIIAEIVGSGDGGEASLIRSMMEAPLAGTGRPMNRRAFRNEAAVLFMAGHETTANTLAWAWFLLSQDAETEARLHAEADTALAGRAATFEDLPALKFTRAVVEETLRLYPPVPLQVRQATGDCTLGGRAVPAGSLVIVNAWLLHRHHKYWADPDVFQPERFLPGGSGVPSRYAYIPFSIGPRICTGAAFGLTEVIICLATLAQHMRLRLQPGFRVTPTCRLSLRPGERLPMSIEPRMAVAATDKLADA